MSLYMCGHKPCMLVLTLCHVCHRICCFSCSHTRLAGRGALSYFPSPHRMLELQTFILYSTFLWVLRILTQILMSANAFYLLRHLPNPCPHSFSWVWPHPSTRPATVLMAVGRDRVVGTHPGVLRGSEVTAACVFGRGQGLSCLVSRCAWL